MEPPTSLSPVTQKDVARSLGVSLGTVSMALRDDPRISESRRLQIHRAALDMGYQRNPAAAALAHYRKTSTIKPMHAALAWMNHWAEPGRLRVLKEFDLYWKGASAAAEKFGYRLEEFQCSGPVTPERVERILVARGIEGILLPPHKVSPNWGNFDWGRFSVVRFGRSVITPDCFVVTADQVANMMLAYRRICELGYERIGFVAEPANMNWYLFEAGFLMAQQAVPIKNRLPIFRFSPGDRLTADKGPLSRWLKKERPDAIISTIPEAREILGSLGLRIPDDISMAAMSILDGNADAGIYQNSEEIGRAAMLSLISLIHDHDRGPSRFHRELLVKGSWVDGSTMPARTSVAYAELSIPE